MKILISGGTGFIGGALVEALLKRGDNLFVLTRSKKISSENRLRYVIWNPEDEKAVISELDGAHAVINLAGELIAKRWTGKQKEKIIKSRVNATRMIGQSIKQAMIKPQVFINASAIGYYGPCGNEALSEETLAGSGFLAETCKAWEANAVRVEDYNVRVVRLRIGIVLGKEGGALPKMLLPFQMGFGGWLGHGNQWFSWIHRDDLVRLIIFCLDQEQMKGAVNAVSPLPVTNKAFSMVLAQVLSRPCLLPVPAFALKLLMGEMSEMLLTGQRVIPKKADEGGFSYQFPEIRSALENILK